MISSQTHQPLYNLGPKPRLKGFHKSQLETSRNNRKPSIIQPSSYIKSFNFDQNQLFGSNSYNDNYFERLSCGIDSVLNDNTNLFETFHEEDNDDQQVSQTTIPHSLGTSFLQSTDLLERLSINEIRSSFPALKNFADLGRDTLEASRFLFHRACREGSLNTVISMLDKDTSLLNGSYENVSPLYACIEANSYVIFKELLKRRANISEGFYHNQNNSFTKITCLYMAIHMGNYRMVEDLLQRINCTEINVGKIVKKFSSKFEENPLYLAVRLGDVKMVRILLREQRFWPHFNLVNSMVSKNVEEKITNTIFQSLFSIEGRTFLEIEGKSRECFLEINRIYTSVGVPIAAIQEISSEIRPFSLYHFGRCTFSGKVIKTIRSPLYLAIMNENDYLTRKFMNCVPNKYLGEFESESCLYLAIYKRSIHVIIYLLRINAETLEDENKLKVFAKREGIDLDHYIKVAKYFTNNMFYQARGIAEHFLSDLKIITRK